MQFVSSGVMVNKALMVRDPDGHAIEIEEQ
jgi:hypothetical protein